DEIKRKKDAGELSETEAAEKKKELVKKSAVSAKKQIESKLTEGHQKLAVDEAELAAQLAPYNTIEEKLNSLAEAEEVATFENDLLVVIDQKKKDKLDNIANEAIAEIKKEIDGDQNVELGVNEDFENVIKGLVDPDEIESLKSKIVKLVREQKLSQSLEGTNTSSDGKNPNSPSLLK
ncbi:29028_t:CDS:1, partial [Racocetra persica]